MQTPGSFLKTYTGSGVNRVYYKLSNSDYRGVYGHESVNELIASRLLDILDITHVSYRLIHSRINIDGKEHETWMCSSKNFRKEGQEKIPFDTYFELMRENDETPIQFCEKRGWDEQVAGFDVLKDYSTNNYFFTHFLEKNLEYIPGNIRIKQFDENYFGYIMRGMNKVLPQVYTDKIWEMISKRWCNYERIQNSK